MFGIRRATTIRRKTSPVLLIPLIALIAVWVYACEGAAPTESSAVNADPSLKSQGNRTKLSSTFDEDADDWTISGDANGAAGFGPEAQVGYWLQPDYDPAGGSSGGAIYATDDGRGIDWYWQAPPKFLGNRLGSYGATLEFDRRQSATDDQFVGVRPDVILAGAGLTLLIDACPNPGTEWTHCTVPLDESGEWKVRQLVVGNDATREQIRQVLDNLIVLRIQGEFRYGFDRAWLDNVRILPKGHSK